jgi:hypothetical protein
MSSVKIPLAASLAAGFGLLACVAAWFFTSEPDAPQRPASSFGGVPPPPPAHLEFVPTAIGAPVAEFERPWVTHLEIVDLDRDGRFDVIYCEAQKNSVRWIRQEAPGIFVESIIGGDIAGPAHVAVGDVNGSGRNDVLIAGMGRILPTNDRIGTVVVLENRDNRHFTKRVLLENVARVSDVRAANIAGHRDGRRDLVVGQFGYDQGETRWMRNLGEWKFESHTVSTLSGCIHVPVADLDADGRDEFAALISQEWEEIHLFRPGAQATLENRIVWGSTNEDFGSSGLAWADVNRDNQPDLIYTNGDGFDYAGPTSRRWQGMQWLEGGGDGTFTYHRVGDFAGAFGPCAADLDSDGDVDLLAVSCFGDFSSGAQPSMMAWLNDGRQNFSPIVLARAPTHLVTAATADLDGDGSPEIVTGGLHIFPPWDHMSNITLWRRKH